MLERQFEAEGIFLREFPDVELTEIVLVRADEIVVLYGLLVLEEILASLGSDTV